MGSAKRPLAERMRPERLEDFVGQEHILGPGKPLRRQIERDELTSIILWGPPGVGKTTLARLIARRDALRVHPLQRGAQRHQGDQSGDGRRRAPAPPGPPHHPVHRRNSPLQQSAAGRLSAVRGARRHHPDRRHHGEPVVRGDLGAAFALARVCAARPHRAGDRDAARPGAAGGGADGFGRAAGADRHLLQRRRAPGLQHAGSGRRRPRARRADRKPPWRTPCSARCCSTTRAAKSTST